MFKTNLVFVKRHLIFIFIIFTFLFLSINISYAQYQAYAWGDNTYGQLGIGIDYYSPKQIGTDWSMVSCGYRFNVGIKTDGSLWA